MTVLAELAEAIDPALLPQTAATAPLPWAQRLGYLLDLAQAEKVANALKPYVDERAREYTPPCARRGSGERTARTAVEDHHQHKGRA